MKKTLLILCFSLLLLCLPCLAPAIADTITIPDNVTVIEEEAFSGAVSLTNVFIPDSVTSIGDHAFSYCSNLTDITIPDSVVSFGTDVFLGCTNLTVTCNEGSVAAEVLNGIEGITLNIIGGNDHITSIALNRDTLVLNPGSSELLIATYTPAGIQNPNIIWTSSNTNVVSVDSFGIVSAVSTGSASITVSYANNNSISASCTVNVVYPLFDIILNRSGALLEVNDVLPLTATFVPDNNADFIITWTSSNSSCAAVSENGTVTAIAPGHAVIRAYVDDHPDIEGICEITVVEKTQNMVSGCIREMHSGQAVNTAAIVILNDSNTVIAQTNTDNNGRYLIPLDPGNYTIIISKNGYMETESRLFVSASYQEYNYLIERKVSFHGYVYGTQDDEPVSDAHIVAQDIAAGNTAETDTNEDGNFTLMLKPGCYQITVTADNCAAYITTMELRNTEISVDIPLGPESVHFDGHVYDEQTDEDVSGATVEMWNESESQLAASARTDHYGMFSLDLTPGRYVIKVMKTGYTESSQILIADCDIDEEIALTCAYVHIDGCIYDLQTDETVEGALVEIRDAAGNQLIASAASDSFGEFALNVIPGKYLLRVTHDGYTDYTQLLTVDYSIGYQDIYLANTYIQVYGSVYDRDDDDCILNATVQIRDETGKRLIASSKTNEDGEYTMDVAPGKYLLRVTKTNYIRFEQPVTITYSNNVFDVTLTKSSSGHSVFGKVTSQSQTGLKNVAISVKAANSSDVVAQATTNSTGVYSLDLSSGDYIFCLHKTGYADLEVPVTIPANGCERNFVMSKLLRIEGYVSDRQSGDAIEDAVIEIWSSDTGAIITSLQTDDDGYYTYTITPGSYVFTATKTQYNRFEKEYVITESSLEQSIVMERSCVIIDGEVYDLQTEEGVPGAVIIVYRSADNSSAATFATGADGSFHTELSPDKYIFSISKEHYIDPRITVNITYDIDYQQFYIGRDAVHFEGCVTDRQTGDGIQNILVSVYDTAGTALVSEITTDEYGNYSGELPPGEYRFDYSKADYIPYSENILIDYNTDCHDIVMMRETVLVDGYILDRQTGEVIEGAQVRIYRADSEGIISLEQTTGDNGYYSFELRPAMYGLMVSKDGYAGFSEAIIVSYDMETMEFTMSPLFVAIQGRVESSLTRAGLEGVRIQCLIGGSGVIVNDTFTNAEGYYSLTLDPGEYVIRASASGYVTDERTVTVDWDTEDIDFVLIYEITSDQYRIRMTWGETPADLDSHLSGYTSSGTPFHVFFSDMNAYEGSLNVCNLDIDDTTSYGPEVITLTADSHRPYYYYVHNYSGEGSIPSSGVRIEVFKGSNLIRTFDAPTGGTERYWNVFAIINDQIIESNTVTSEPDINYVGSTPITSFLIQGETSHTYPGGKILFYTISFGGSGDCEYCFELYRDSNMIAASDWNRSSQMRITFTETGTYHVAAKVRDNSTGDIHTATSSAILVTESGNNSTDEGNHISLSALTKFGSSIYWPIYEGIYRNRSYDLRISWENHTEWKDNIAYNVYLTDIIGEYAVKLNDQPITNTSIVFSSDKLKSFISEDIPICCVYTKIEIINASTGESVYHVIFENELRTVVAESFITYEPAMLKLTYQYSISLHDGINRGGYWLGDNYHNMSSENVSYVLAEAYKLISGDWQDMNLQEKTRAVLLADKIMRNIAANKPGGASIEVFEQFLDIFGITWDTINFSENMIKDRTAMRSVLERYLKISDVSSVFDAIESIDRFELNTLVEEVLTAWMCFVDYSAVTRSDVQKYIKCFQCFNGYPVNLCF